MILQVDGVNLSVNLRFPSFFLDNGYCFQYFSQKDPIDQNEEAMTKTTEVPLGELKAKLSEFVSQSSYQNKRFVITRHNKPVAALVSIEYLQKMERCMADSEGGKK